MKGNAGVTVPTQALATWEQAAASNPLARFVDEILRGFGQVMFQNSPITGLLFLIGVFGGGWQFGVSALLGTAASTLTAHWLGVPGSAIQSGLYGYNGTLVGVALAFYLSDTAILPVYVTFAGIVVAVVAAAMGNFLGAWQLPALTGPFVVTTGIFALGIFGFSQLSAGVNSGAPALPAISTGSRAALEAQAIWDGLFHGVSQVFFQDGVWIGAIFVIGILANSRIDALMAVIGSAIGLAVGWLLGVEAGSLALGLMGYNAVLTMMALGGLFYVLDRNSFAMAAIAAATSVVVTIALTALVTPFGGHIYTAPFVVTTWAFIAAKPFLHTLQAVNPADATTPEANLNLYRARGHWWERPPRS